tara:strand:- start:86 stop:1948 length:1863 start_codon:yes stop_codon:yes gene_type:complete
MCIGGGGGSTPPPPDYTAEKTKFGSDARAAYQTEADAYNTNVDAFNNSLLSQQSSLKAGEDAFSNANIYDLYDDPNTKDVNEDPLAKYQEALAGEFDYSSLDASAQNFGEQPIFNPVVQSPWGAVTINDLPTLSNVNTTLGDDLYDRGKTLGTNIDNLYGERETKFGEFMTSASGVEQAAGKLTNNVNRAGIASDLNALSNSLSDITIDGQNLSSNPFYNQSKFAGGDQPAYIAGIQDKITALDNAKAAELSRISTYEGGINTSANDLANEAAGLGIGDMTRVNEIEREIAKLTREAGQFNSQLGYDFSDELGGLSGASNSIAGVSADYDAELARINEYEADTLKGVRGIRDSAFSTNMYSMGGLDALDNSLTDFKTDASGFSSVLPYEVSGLEDYYKTISDRSTALRGDRSTALDAIQGRIGGVTGGLGDIELYNEGGFNEASRQLTGIGGDLGRFSGGRVDGIASEIAGGQRTVEGKIRELQAYRSKLEEDMITYLEQVKTGDYYNFEDVATMRDGVSGKESEVRLYKAQQAMDEITDMIAALDGQDRRLKSDASAAAERQAQSQRGVGFGSYAGTTQGFTPMNASQYSAFVNNGGEEEPVYGSNPSAFSTNLGVIRI